MYILVSKLMIVPYHDPKRTTLKIPTDNPIVFLLVAKLTRMPVPQLAETA